MERKSRAPLLVILIAVTLIAVFLIQTVQVFRLTSSLTKSSGQYQLETISGELESTISDARQLAMELAISAYPLLSDREALSDYIIQRKTELLEEPIGCFNVYIAGAGWAIIPDFDMPDDYVATERDWYKGAKRAQGQPYVAPPYVDAMTGDICYTVAVLLGDGDTVVALDYTMDTIQSHIMRMYDNGSRDAVIVTGDGVIAGCTDETLVGKQLMDVLPDYASVFSLAKSTQSFVSARIKADILYETLFATTSGSGWYLIISESDWTLYRDAYVQLIGSAVITLLLTGIIVAVLLLSVHRRRAAQRSLGEKDRLLRSITDRMEGPLQTILDSADLETMGASGGSTEKLTRIRTAARQMAETLREAGTAESGQTREKRGKPAEKSLRMNARFRTRILLLMVLVVIISVASNSWIALRWGNEMMRREVSSYEYTLSEWVSNQKRILDMFCSVISTNPEMLEDYEGTVAYLDRITEQYPEISVSYMTNPTLEHTVYMNNGWTPPEGWHVEERQWYIDTMASENGWSISAPYYDEQTGLYCVTFSERVYDADNGDFLGNFGIDFYLDKLIDIMGGSYSDESYAFLADADGIIINHPYGSYQMSQEHSTSISELPYGEAKPDGESPIIVKDYDGVRRIVIAKRNEQSHFTVYEAVDLFSVYAPTMFSEVLTLIVTLICAAMVYRLLSALLRWQDEVNARVQEAADAAIAAGEAKSRFLAQMSHEIRTPINAVLGMNEMILRKTDDEAILEYAGNIQTAGRILLSLINSILDFSKIEEGKMEIVPVEYDTTSVINNLVTSISERAREKDLALIVDVDKTLPSRLYGDDVRLSQVIMNLLTNAVKYTKEGSVRFSVSGGARTDGMLELNVSVEDTGIGIREEDIPRLFESFERLDEVRNHNIEGTGLGMTIVTRLLDMMGSRLQVRSVYGQGSVFSFTVLQKILDEAPIGDYTERLSISQSSDGRAGFTAAGADVLVVDDNEMNLKVAENLLKLFGISADLAGSGFEAIDRVREKHYDILFLDHMMPKMDGIETMDTLKREALLPADTAVIVLTANAVNGAKERYLSLGFDDYLSKPIVVDSLEELLIRYLPGEKLTMVSPEDPAVTGETGGAADACGPAEEDGPLEKLAALGFNTRAGLGYAAGDRAFYLDMLRRFAQEEPDKAAAIRADHDVADLHDYEIRVHALKSSARMVGADDLSALALAQENAAREGDGASVDSGYAHLLEVYDHTAAEIADAFGQSLERQAAQSELPSDVLREKLEEAAACLETFETERAEAVLKELFACAYEGRPLSESLGGIMSALNDFDTERAAELLGQFRSRL